MPYTQYQNRVDDLIKLYKRNPELFNENQLQELETLAQQSGTPFSRKPEEFSAMNIARQMTSGFVSGMTTVPVGDPPKNTYEKIAHSLGHLAGFAPGIMAGPSKLLSKGMRKANLQGPAKALDNFADVGAPMLDQLSIPMIVSRKSQKLVDSALDKSGMASYDFMKRGAKTSAILKEAVGLGSASLVSNIWEGPDQYLNTFVGGAIAGGVFGGIGNFVSIGNRLKFGNAEQRLLAENSLKASIGATFQGGNAFAHGEPLESVIYETLLGGFFGYKARPAHQAEGGKFFQSLAYGIEPEVQFNPSMHRYWNKFSKKAQGYITEQSSHWAKNYTNRLYGEDTAFNQARLMAQLTTNKPKSLLKQEEIDAGYRKLAYETYKNLRIISAGELSSSNDITSDHMKNAEPDDFTDHISIDQSVNNLAVKVRAEVQKDPGLKIATKNINLAGEIVETFNANTLNGNQRGVNSFIEGVQNNVYLKGAVANNKQLVPLLKKWYHNYNRQRKPVYIVEYDKNNNPIATKKVGEFAGKNLGVINNNFPMDLLHPDPTGNRGLLTDVSVPDPNKGGIILLKKPLAFDLDPKTNKAKDSVSPEQLFHLFDHLDRKNTYVLSGVKDKDFAVVDSYHLDYQNYNPNTIGKSMKADAKAYDTALRASRVNMFKLLGVDIPSKNRKMTPRQERVLELHDKQWVSNILNMGEMFGLHRAGQPINPELMSKLNSDKYFKNVVDLNKRMQGFVDKGVPMQANDYVDILPEGQMPFIFVKDFNPKWLKTTNESATDGTVILDQKVFDRTQSNVGNPNNNGTMKTVLIGRYNSNNNLPSDARTLFSKNATERAPKKFQEFMDKHGIKALIFDSSAKIKTHGEGVTLDYVNGEYVFRNPQQESSISVGDGLYKMPVSNMRVNLGTYENMSHQRGNMKIVLQLGDVLNSDQTPGGAKMFFNEIIKPRIEGDPVLNKLTSEEMVKRMKENSNFIEEISPEIVIKEFAENPDSQLSRLFARKIMKMDKENSLEQEIYDKDEHQTMLYRNKRILEEGDFNHTVRHIFPYSRGLFDPAFSRWLTSRYRQPKHKESGKSILRSVTPDSFDGRNANIIDPSRPISEGEIILNSGMRNTPAKNPDGSKTTLGKLFDAYKKKPTPELEQALELVVIRTPADSVSGVRILKLRGFSKEKGSGAITHPKDDAYLGGADKDIDSVTFYQGFSKGLKDQYRKNKNEWEGKPNKPKEDNSIFQGKDDPSFKDVYSKFSPSMRFMAGRSAHQGNKNLGPGLSTKKFLDSVYDTIINTKKTNFTTWIKVDEKSPFFKYASDKGFLAIRSNISPKNKNSGDRLRDLGRQIVNRFADASEVPNFKKVNNILDSITNEVFDVKVQIGNGKKFVSAESVGYKYTPMEILNKTFGSLRQARKVVNPKAKSSFDGKNISLEERANSLDRLNTVKGKGRSQDKGFTLSDLIAERMIADGLNRRTGVFDNTSFARDFYLEVNKGTIDSLVKFNNAKEAKLINELMGMDRVFITPENIGKAIENHFPGSSKAIDFAFNDVYQLVARNAIAKSAVEIYRDFQKSGNTSQPFQDAKKFMHDIAREAVNLKRKYQLSRRLNTDEPDSLNKTDNKSFDQEVKDVKIRMFNNAAKNKIGYKPIEKYFDLWLLSPFKSSMLKKPTGPNIPKIQPDAWNSKEINSKNVRSMLKEFNDVVNLIEGKDITPKDISSQVNKIIKPLSDPEPTTVKDVQGTAEKAHIAVEKAIDKLDFKIVNEKDAKIVNELKQNLSKYPRWADNLEDMFLSWHVMEHGYGKTLDRANIADLRKMNNFLKEPDVVELSRKFYYMDPRTISRQLAKHDIVIMDQYRTPVLTTDGVKMKKVKKMTSTFGLMTEWFNKSKRELNPMLDSVEPELKRLFPYRNVIKSVKDRDTFSQWLIETRMGRYYKKPFDYKSTPEYKEMLKRYPRIDKMFEQSDKSLTKYFEKVHKQYLVNEKDMELIEYNKDGSFNFDKFFKIFENPYNNKKFKMISLNTLYKAQYEWNLEKIILNSTDIKNPVQFRNNFRKKYPFKPIGEIAFNEYYPKLNFGFNKKSRAEINNWIQEQGSIAYEKAIQSGKSESDALADARMVIERHRLKKDASLSDAGHTETEFLDTIVGGFDYHTLSANEISSTLERIGFFNRPRNVLERIGDEPGYDTRAESLDSYTTKVLSSIHKNMAALFGDYAIHKFQSQKKLDVDLNGKDIPLSSKRMQELRDSSNRLFTYRNNTDVFADFMRFHLRDFLGHKSTFPDRIMHAKNNSDVLKLKYNFYYGTSDSAIINGLERLNKIWVQKWGTPLPFMKDLPIGNDANTRKLRNDYYSNMLHKMGMFEARYNLLTLLANTGVMIGNAFGGSALTIGNVGIRNFSRAFSRSYLNKNIIFDKDGNSILKFKNGDPIKNKKDLINWISEKGILDTLIRDEFEYNPGLKSTLKELGPKANEFIRELGKLVRRPSVSDNTILELADRYGVKQAIIKSGAFFMNSSERFLRSNAYIAHALQARDRFGRFGLELDLNDPYIQDAALKGVETTQFLYDAQNRPAFMKTSLGRVLTRFKLFAFNSVRVRKEILKNLKDSGFDPNSEEGKRYRDLFTIDLFTMALGSVFAYSLFDTSLPPPWDWLQETSEWLFGDKRERDRAFFGQYPYPIAPLQIVTPPIARVPMSLFSSLINNDWESFMDYNLHTLYPFGRIVRGIDKTIYDKDHGNFEVIKERPYGTTFGRFMQQFLRIPTDKFAKAIEKAQVKKDRERLIEEELGV